MNLVAADERRLILFPEKRLEPYVGDYGSQAEFLAKELIQFACPLDDARTIPFGN